MQKKVIGIKVAGAAGQGVESGGLGLTKVLKRSGFHVFGVSDYMSLIKGGHNFYQIALSDEPIHCHLSKFHVVVCFDPQNIKENLEHVKELHKGGLFIVDDSTSLSEEFEKTSSECGVNLLKLPLNKLANDVGGNKIMANTVALGSVVGLLGIPFDALGTVVKENFGKKDKEVAEKNASVAKAGYDYVQNNCKNIFKFDVPKINLALANKMLMNGNDAIAFGSYVGGCRFFSAYPMTPGTSVFEWFTKRNVKLGVVTKHTEDEIAAICMAIGAGHVGARAMTSTSGGGFCLMVEALGLAGITETPVVAVNVMRGGPSTGLPTRTEQADLLFSINCSHGEFPRIVLTPGTTEQCFEAGRKAHDLAEKYQLPVVILSDQLLAAAVRDTDPNAYEIKEINRGKLLSEDELNKLQEGEYLRFKFTEDGISPRALPGHPKAVYAPPTDEHDETAHINESKENRIKMMNKRMKKLETAVAQDIKGPELYGPENADLTMIIWGSVYGAAAEAVDAFNRQSKKEKINFLHFSEVWPFPVQKTLEALKKTKFTVAVEQNYTYQFAKLLKSETGHEVKAYVNRYDGRPIESEEIVSQIENIIKNSLIAA